MAASGVTAGGARLRGPAMLASMWAGDYIHLLLALPYYSTKIAAWGTDPKIIDFLAVGRSRPQLRKNLSLRLVGRTRVSRRQDRAVGPDRQEGSQASRGSFLSRRGLLVARLTACGRHHRAVLSAEPWLRRDDS